MYEKQNFLPGQKLKAAQLNHMEDGIAAAVSVNEQTLTDKQRAQARKNIGIGNHIEPIGEFVYSFPLTDATYMSDHTFIGDKLYVINASSDDHSSYAGVTVYKVDPDAKTATYEKTIQHNLGHANSIDYCAGTDCLILGNGSSDATLPGKIFILPNVSAKTSWEFSDCIVIDVSEKEPLEVVYIAAAGLDTANGNLIDPYTSRYGVIDYVAVTGSTITCNRAMYKICFYGVEKNFISTIRASDTESGGYEFTVPIGSAYARIMFEGLSTGHEIEDMKTFLFTGIGTQQEHPSGYHENTGLDTGNGTDFDYEPFWVLGYVSVTGEKIVCSSPMYKVCFYDPLFTFISTVRGGYDVYEINVPNGAVYARVQMMNDIVPFEDATTLTWQGIELVAKNPTEILWGIKVQAVWGEHNNELYNIAYVVSNNNSAIRKILLGKTDGQFDGTFILLKEWFAETGFDVNQGTVFRNGKIYAAIGHSQLWMTENTLNDDGTITQRQRKDVFFDSNGAILAAPFSEGITIHNGYLYFGGSDFGGSNRIYVYKNI